MEFNRPCLDSLKRKSYLSWLESEGVDTTPYPLGIRSSLATISSKYSYTPDPQQWGFEIIESGAESDDEMHSPADIRPSKIDRLRYSYSTRGLANTGFLVIFLMGLIALFIAYPIIKAYGKPQQNNGPFYLGFNATGQVPLIPGNFGLIDIDTPNEAHTKMSWDDPSIQMQLVFSDEFNTDGRSFYPGDDPYWEAVDLHYWATNNLEWYDPEAITTSNGSLIITLTNKETHGLHYEGGLLSTWNKFCFTGGYVETSVMLPGSNNVVGLWPAVWALGNLGRVGYGATLEGTWPYTYDSCDVGTVANQTVNGEPVAATINGDTRKGGGALSYLPGQRLSRCTCPGESHPGPKHSDGTFVGRAAPEIDVFEAQINGKRVSEVSQTAQWAPFNNEYAWLNDSNNMIIPNPAISKRNSYVGGATQQATSVVTQTEPTAYELNGGGYSVYGFEYKPGFNDAYITWISSGTVSWTLRAPGLGPDPTVEISARPVSQEPMYLIANLGMSRNFGPVDLKHLTFPARMHIDYIRVYQPKNAINIGCDPKDFPTESYINQYIEAYTNPNLTTWVNDYHQSVPKNSFLGQC